jgi:hypothetical protein
VTNGPVERQPKKSQGGPRGLVSKIQDESGGSQITRSVGWLSVAGLLE